MNQRNWISEFSEYVYLKTFIWNFNKTGGTVFRMWGEVGLCHYVGYRICCFIVSPNTSGSDSVVSIATGNGLDGPGMKSQCGRNFPHLSRPALVPTRPLLQWVPALSRGKEWPGRDADSSSLLVPWSWKVRAIPLLPVWPYVLYRASVLYKGALYLLPSNSSTLISGKDSFTFFILMYVSYTHVRWMY
jgi:hypothetical protein